MASDLSALTNNLHGETWVQRWTLGVPSLRMRRIRRQSDRPLAWEQAALSRCACTSILAGEIQSLGNVPRTLLAFKDQIL